MEKVLVLGSGMVGSAMALDMAKKHDVTVADIDRDALRKIASKNKNLRTLILDVRNKKQLQQAVGPFDLVICAVPGFLGFQTLENLIESKKDTVDISFFPEDALALNDAAIKNGVTAVVDCGVAPGMGNIILGHYNKKMKVDFFECLVGGLPKKRKWPFNYKAPFSPVDVLEEYTRPARYVENGEMITREALSDVELIDFEGIGSLEAFNSDGLRSLIKTMPHIANMKEKTLRYPGHAEYISVLKSSGFFSKEFLDFDGKKIAPMEFTSRILFNEWKLAEGEPEFTVMRITIRGKDTKGKDTEVIYDLYDEFDPGTGISSMARTTGYTATAVANLILEGKFSGKGVFPPELIGSGAGVFEYVMNYLAERGVIYSRKR